MKKLSILTLIVFIFFALTALAAEEVEWKYIAPNNYIYKEGITGTEEMYGYSFLLKSYNKGQYEPVNGRNISYTLGQYEINCAKRTYKVGLIDSYDENGIFINGDYNKYASFQPIVSDTAVYEVANKLCKFN